MSSLTNNNNNNNIPYNNMDNNNNNNNNNQYNTTENDFPKQNDIENNNNNNVYNNNNNNVYNNNQGSNPYDNVNSNNDNKEKIDVDNNDNDSNDINDMMRIGFIRKVYGVLCTQLLLTFAIASLGFLDSVKYYYRGNMTLFWVGFSITILTIIPLACFKKLARTVPTNYILLFLFTIGESIMISYLVSLYPPHIVITALALTALIVIALTVYACTTKSDFAFCGGLLFVSVVLLIFFGVFSWAFGYVLHTLYCVLGVFVFSIYLIFDTQLVMGKLGCGFSVDDYVFAALNIYIDIIQLFLYILAMFGRR